MDNNNNPRIPMSRPPRSPSLISLPPLIRRSFTRFMPQHLQRRYGSPNHRYSIQDEFSSSDFFDSEAGLLEACKQVHGKYRPILNGMFVLGPGRFKLCITFFFYSIILALLILQHYQVASKYGYFVPYIGYFLWVMGFQFMFCTATTDPGIMPRDVGYSDHSIRYLRNLPRELGHAPRYCGKCNRRRPPRTYHCDVCNICIRYQDMHAGLLGTCIGERNFRYYYFLNVTLVVLSGYLISVNALLLKAAKVERSFGARFWNLKNIISIILICYGLIICLMPQTGILIFLYRFYLIAHQRTVHEDFRAIVLGRAYTERMMRHVPKKSYGHAFLAYLFPVPYTRSYLARGNQTRGPRGQGTSAPSQQFRHWAANSIAQSEQHLLDDIPRFRSHRDRSSSRAKKEKDANADMFGNAASAKRKAFYSMPMLHDGEVGRLPSTRQRFLKRSRPTDVLASKLILYQELMETPKAVADRQFQRQRFNTGSLSLGDMPRSAWNVTAENEIVYQARAAQIQRVVELVQRRDRLGLIALSRRINVGALMGLQELDPDNLQIIELNNNGIPMLGGRRATRLQRQQMNRGGIGISQMVAAGLMSRLDGSIVREMVPPVPPALPAPPVQQQAIQAPADRDYQLQRPFDAAPAPRLLRATIFRNNPALNDLRGAFMRQSAITQAPQPIPNTRDAGQASSSRSSGSRHGHRRNADLTSRVAWDPSVVVVMGQPSIRPRGTHRSRSPTSRRERERNRNTNADGNPEGAGTTDGQH